MGDPSMPKKDVGWNVPTVGFPSNSGPVGYSTQQDYAPQPPGYPIQQGYPTQQGYASQAPGYPIQQGYTGYPIQQGFADQPPSYPIQQGFAAEPPSYPIQLSYPVTPKVLPGIGQVNQVQPSSYPDVEGQNGQIKNEDFGASFSTREIRHRFVRKVYSIVTFQLLISLGIIALFTLHEGVQGFVKEHIWLVYLSYAVFLVTYIILVCCTSVRRKWPGNMILLLIFTLAMSYLLGVISSFYKTEIVFMSVGITTLICFLITLFAIQTKIDFTGSGIYLCIGSCVLFVFGLMAILMRNPTMNLLYSAGIVFLFSMFLVFDTQRIIGGRKHDLSAEEHVTAALVLYVDVVNIFLGILGLARHG